MRLIEYTDNHSQCLLLCKEDYFMEILPIYEEIICTLDHRPYHDDLFCLMQTIYRYQSQITEEIKSKHCIPYDSLIWIQAGTFSSFARSDFQTTPKKELH